MPIYENRHHAENRIRLSENQFAAVKTGLEDAINALIVALTEQVSPTQGAVILCDGWYGVDYSGFAAAFKEELEKSGYRVNVRSTAAFFKTPEMIAKQKHPWITDEPAFGRVNMSEILSDYADMKCIEAIRGELAQSVSSGVVEFVCGPGALLVEIATLRIYLDQIADPMLWKMWTGELIPFGSDVPRRDYGWKEYYYCDFYIMQRHKGKYINDCNFYAEAIELDKIKLLPADVYVRDHLKPRAKVVKWNKEYSMDRFATLPQMPFEIARLHFTKCAEYTTEGKYLQALTLTVGEKLTICSIKHPERQASIDRLQCALVPAGFGEYEVIAENEGAHTVVIWHLKPESCKK